ncbi:LptF/LptG family permease [Rhizomicrobium electricum]|uniref:Permease YjgP/YjgQ family protein n=1 Tax=Rhizomicrobium electricum TaxID=480070 RepID=A0ABN1EFJ7_9PROT|nr:LptF/LptG family permease [Rhizomicrobium electricum]NIJ48585.1 lipopolysaccharide export LptBFGC system permease protein LptF [Rhizomicrobium electricum]
MSEAATRPRIVFAPFGRHTAYLLAGYLRHVLIVTSVLLAIALTIDLWPQFQDVAAKGSGDFGAVWSVVRFSALRTPGLIAPLLPFATFIGVLWTEVAHTQAGERMLVWNSGRSPLQCLSPVLLAGLILGGADFVMDGYMGPASMGIQMVERLGRDGARLDRAKLSDPAWMTAGGGILRAQIQYGPPPVLRNVMFFARDAGGRLTEVDVAPMAVWEEGTDRWTMQNGQYWKAGSKEGVSRTVFAGRATHQSMTPFAEKSVTLAIDPLWFTWHNLQPQYIPVPVLAKLAASERVPDAHGQYETRLHVVLSEAVLPGLMALLASALSMLFMAYRTPAPALVGIMFCGYIAHFGTKACLIMGQNGYMDPVIAGWLVPACLLVVIATVFALIEAQRKGKIAPSAG